MGMNDLQGEYDTIEECHTKFHSIKWNCFVNYHIFDSIERKVMFNHADKFDEKVIN